MIGLVALLTVLGLSLVITHIATVALVLTGLSRDSARFQARSAFTGTGFTTGEAEKVVNHPVRRRIIMLLMIGRSAGLVSILISLILSFGINEAESERIIRLLYLIAGVILLWLTARNRIVEHALTRIIEWALHKWTHLDTRDYFELLKLSGGYSVRELHVEEGDWLAGRELRDCRLTEEGVTVLGVYRRDRSYVGAPGAQTPVDVGDTVLLYGQESLLEELDHRRADPGGERAHDRAVEEHKRRQAAQEHEDRMRMETTAKA
jgi:hypothetical protein